MKHKKITYRSDFMSRKQDDQLEQLEEKLTALYANAANEIQSTLTDFMDAYKKQDEKNRAAVEAGAMPEDEYTAWRRSQMLNNTRYTAAVENMTNTLVNTDVAAMALTNGELPRVLSESFDFTTALGSAAAKKAGIETASFQIYNQETVQALVKDKPNLFPKPSQKTIKELGGTVDIPEDKKWNKDRITRELTQGIVQGESINKIADRLERVTNMDKNAAIRNARTAYTSAENLGRTAAAEDLKEQGIPIEEVWSATYDNRTRETHLMLDGTKRDESGYFGVGILNIPLRYPADPDGEPEEVYNCRCRLNIELAGIDHSKDDELYDQFMKENYPDDYEALKENEPYQARQQEAEATKDRQAELRSQHPELTAQTKEPETTVQPKEPEIIEDKYSRREKAQVMEMYVAEEGFAMNAYARGEDISKWDYLETSPKQIKDLTDKFTDILENERTTKEEQVYRGATFDTLIQNTGLTEKEIRDNPEDLIGKTITEKGFMSTSSSYTTAEDYASGNVVMRIDLPKGAKAIDQNEYLKDIDSKEKTIQRNCDLKIKMAYETEDAKGRKIIIVQAEYIDAGIHKKKKERRR